MHIREQGKSLQLLRTTYDPLKKRGVQKLICRMPHDIDVIPDNIKSLLSREELQHLKDYLTTLSEVKKQQKQVESLVNIVTNLDLAISALPTANTIQNFNVDEVWSALDRFSLALRKAGYVKPKKAAKQ